MLVEVKKRVALTFRIPFFPIVVILSGRCVGGSQLAG